VSYEKAFRKLVEDEYPQKDLCASINNCCKAFRIQMELLQELLTAPESHSSLTVLKIVIEKQHITYRGLFEYIKKER
jgi:hypothetical protein